ncbi:cysteine--tRNA ligase [Caulobacter sp. S45]|uniref:cysteine--tRNA ligase n=1 Tax=Caulobacter sp. S45 TaxID=1641861 RepID=UPI001575CD72|nr:cysteine--tRNA ligase [Caulobacter sp. S45]
MTLHIHDTLRRGKVTFTPLDPSRVTLYVCGPTVYSYAHIGNARPAVVFDVLFRLLRRAYGGEEVIYARNITDVDDKIAAAAEREGVDISVIASRFAEVYEADMAALGVLKPTLEPRATAHVPQMIEMIVTLVKRGHAYVAEGDVLFDVSSFPAYGALSGRSLEDMQAGARVDVVAHKRSPADFTLWKPSKPGEPAWASPWGPGRPGWHIECSAMIEAELGFPVDIHGGGHDLIFPHHENEIAQGVCAADGEAGYARYWMHNGFLTLEAEKMSKSLGNVLLVHDLLKQVPGEVVRWALLSAHYRAPLDWTGELLEQSRRTLDRIYDALRFLSELDPAETSASLDAEPHEGVLQALNDDLNTPLALSYFGNYVKDVRLNVQNSSIARENVAEAIAKIVVTGRLLGVLQTDVETWFKGNADADLSARVEALIASRAEARKAKDWAEADRIRGELGALNVEVLDGPGGAASWRLKA